MLILLPPSEGKSAPRRGKPLDLASLSFPGLTPTRERLLDALVDLCSGDPQVAARVLDVGSTQLDLVDLDRGLRTNPTARADAVYAGVVYDALDVTTLSPAARRRATSRLAITSSVFGLVRPGDRIPAYRLSGGTSLPGVGPVAGAWREVLGPATAEALGGGLLVDLRSSTYAAFWRPTPDLASRVATVRVLHEVDGTRKVVSHFNKATKGRLVRALLEDGANPRTPARLAEALRDLAQKGSGLESVIPRTVDTASDALIVPLRLLSRRLSVKVPLPEALSLFADEVDDASADTVVAALALSARQRRGRLSDVLGTLSEALRDELEQRTKIMRERNMIRREAAQVAALTAVLVIGANLFAPPSLPNEADSAAQVLPLLLAVAFVFVFSRVRKLAEPEIQPRFLSSSAEVLEAATYRPKTLPGARRALDEEGTR